MLLKHSILTLSVYIYNSLSLSLFIYIEREGGKESKWLSMKWLLEILGKFQFPKQINRSTSKKMMLRGKKGENCLNSYLY